MTSTLDPNSRPATREQMARIEGQPMQLGRSYVMPPTPEALAAEKAQHEATLTLRAAARANRPTGLLRALAPGTTRLFPGYHGAALSVYIARLGREGLRFTTHQTPEGLEVTRLAESHPAAGLV